MLSEAIAFDANPHRTAKRRRGFANAISIPTGPRSEEHIRRETHRMQQMLDALYTYNNIQTDPATWGAVDIKTMVQDLIADFGPVTNDGHPIMVTTDTLPQAFGDEDLIRQVFFHVMDNAIKFRKPGTAPQLHIASRPDPAGVGQLFSVTDDGLGLHPRDARRIFSLFERLNPGDETNGAGMGLALCHKIIARHGGNIRVHSFPGDGAIFFFTLPKVSPGLSS